MVCLILKPLKSDWLPFVRVAGILVMTAVLIPMLREILDSVTAWFGGGTVASYADVMMRALGISILSKICCDVCRDAGESGLAGGVEMAGKTVILLLCLPLIEEILEYASKILNG